MEDLKQLFEFILSLFKMDFTIYGYNFNLWSIVVWSCVAVVVIKLIVMIFKGGD